MSTATMRHDAAQDEINGELYSRADLVSLYAAPILHPPEAVAMVRYRDDIAGRRVLDLGCGAGRLAVYLRPITDRYVGLDISPHMVDHCRRTVSGSRFERGDMRDLSIFGERSFDSVFAVFNLFDAVNHGDRLKIFGEVRRVLTPGGLLVFSSHNRNYRQLLTGPHLQRSRNPITQLRCVMDYLNARRNHRRIRTRQRFEDDYALVNDSGHNFSVLHYYISRAAQAKQLADTGFRLLECLDESGLTLDDGRDDASCSSIHYVARPMA